jgi:hypothetical protein
VGSTVGDFRFTPTFVLDGVQNLLWSRDLYALGDTTQLFRDAFDSREPFAAAYARVNERAASLSIGRVSGWRVATQKELDELFRKLLPTTVAAYFRARPARLSTISVLGIVEPGVAAGTVPVDGMLYSNTSLGRARRVGPPNTNPYGVWLVRTLSPDIERSFASTADDVRQFLEPVEEQRLLPADVYQVSRQGEAYQLLATPRESASVSTTTTLNSRFYARYNLRPLPRGALVSAEVQMRGRSASGNPPPIVSVQVVQSSIQTVTAPQELWTFANGTAVGIWQMPGNARLEMPEHILRNVYNGGEAILLSFSASYNSCEFEIPEIIVRYVQESNILSRRPLP